MKKKLSTLLSALTGAVILCGCTAAEKKAQSMSDYAYWDLGVGGYGSNVLSDITLLDRARMDWLYVCFGNEPASKANTERLNKYLEMNPKQKYVIRLWPIFRHKRPGSNQVTPVTFLDYLYMPGIKQKLQKTIKSQVDSVMLHISDKNAVYGFTFLEENPTHFSDRGDRLALGAVPSRDMIYYKAQYEKETGKKLDKWNEDTRRWWCAKYLQVTNEINSYIKEVSGGKRVFMYFLSHTRTLDFLAPGENVTGPSILTFYMKDVIGHGADGLFAFPTNAYYLKKWQDLCKELKVPYFSQLSVGGQMRLPSWKDTLAIAKDKSKENVGYFFHAFDDIRGQWNDAPYGKDDPMIQDKFGKKYRMHCAAENVGMDVIRKNFAPELKFDHELKNLQIGGYAPVYCIVRNPADDSWFSAQDKGSGTMKNIRMKIELPKEFELPMPNNPYPVNMTLEELQGGESTIITWWVRRVAESPAPDKVFVKITASPENAKETVVSSAQGIHRIKAPKFYSVSHSGNEIDHIDYELPFGTRGFPTEITIECTARNCIRPAVTLRNDRIIWNGMLLPQDKIRFAPDKKAFLLRKGSKKWVDVSADVFGSTPGIIKGRNNFIYTDESIVTDTRQKAKISFKLLSRVRK